jgi:hypothetical protein
MINIVVTVTLFPGSVHSKVTNIIIPIPTSNFVIYTHIMNQTRQFPFENNLMLLVLLSWDQDQMKKLYHHSNQQISWRKNQ